MLEANSRSSSNNWVLVNAVRILFELLLMELGDLGGGVGVLLRDGDSPAAETSEQKNKIGGENFSFVPLANKLEKRFTGKSARRGV